jgi:uncharacterized repeat protein (TIGR01451 family)
MLLPRRLKTIQSQLKGTDAFITKIGVEADLSITKTDSRDPVLVNSPIHYTLQINNAGPSPATNVVVNDMLPAQLSFVSATPTQGTCSFNSPTVTCQLGTLTPSAGAVVMLTATASTPVTVTNTANVAGTEPDSNSANNSSSQSTKISASPLSTAMWKIWPTWIFFNNGSGGFGQSNVDIPFATQGQPMAFFLRHFTSDVNLDGKADLIVLHNTDTVQILLGNGAGGFTQIPAITFGSFDAPLGLADVNADENPDLLFGSSFRSLSVRLGDGTALSEPPFSQPHHLSSQVSVFKRRISTRTATWT